MSIGEPVRIALVGAGRMGSVHLGALLASSLIEVTAVVEPYAPAREAVAERGLTVFESVEQLLESDRPEGVLIAAPSDQHSALVSQFAAAGVAILCEKPVGVRTADAAAATRAADTAGVLLQVGYWRRFVPELGALRERIRGGELGETYQLSCLQWDAELPSEQFRAHSGGISVDMGVHEFDQTRWLLGQEFESVTAIAAGACQGDRPPSDPDAATILARLSGGTACVVSLGRRFPYSDSCWLEVWGTRGYERIPFMWDRDGDRVFRTSMQAQAEAFAATVRGEPRAGAGGEDAVAALTVAGLTAAALSSGSVEGASGP